MRLLPLPLLALLGAVQDPPPAQKVDFVRDVQPLLKASCLKCHGAEKPKGQFRLDARGPALKGGVGGPAILPGRGADSHLIKLLLDADDEVRMPQKAPALAKEKIDLLRRWIDEGAVWPGEDVKEELHWAYVAPVRRETPPGRHPVDHFLLERLKKEGIAPSPLADRATLIKRATYDLVGLPPTPAEVDAFVRDGDWEKLVDRLLASPHYGERWGRHWLDKARYADSDGYEKDNPRPDAWRYRDWVIDALNDDLPFDRFTVEQLAGDLLPDAGAGQHLATAFHRQTLTNTEGGTDKEQFRVEATFDRAETTGAVWLGLTVGCARCHNHKFDRISQQEYYQLFAFFNNGDETTREVPVSEEAMEAYQPKKAEHDAKLRELEKRLAKERPALLERLPAWEVEIQAQLREEVADGMKFVPLEIVSIKPVHEVTFKKLDDGSWLADGADAATETYVVTAQPPAKPVSGFQLDVLAHKSLPSRGPGRTPHGNFVLTEFKVDGLPLKNAAADFSQADWDVAGALDGNPKTGWAVSPQMGKDHQATFLAEAPKAFDAPLTITLDQQYGERHTIGRFRLLARIGSKPPLSLSDAVRKALAVAPEKRTPEQREAILERVAAATPATRELAAQIEAQKKAEPKAPVMSVRVLQQRAKDPRVTKLFHRGEFLQPKQEVRPGTLASLHPLKARGETPDRLDLARWIVDPANPLTARVLVNQVWGQLFGQGLVRTSNDFGVRGERPSHPELLDWLATELVRLGWSQKALIRRILTSEAYRRASIHRPELADRDPRNDLLYRQNRFRVEGEIVRDLALSVAGLLSKKVGGPSVFPPMPADIAALSYANNFKWKNSEGEDRYRRGMYTYFKRTSPYPHLMNFDCPDSNTTCVQRRTSNTPLQALSMLNNEVFVEAATAFAKRLAAMPDGLAEGFRLCTARAPSEVEAAKLKALHATGGWTAVARVLLNLDEFITRE
ncbi:MAG TPA: PSD1 and planctomycete cytochrome C domain-containing protein [Planctomycetota bacterium]